MMDSESRQEDGRNATAASLQRSVRKLSGESKRKLLVAGFLLLWSGAMVGLIGWLRTGGCEDRLAILLSAAVLVDPGVYRLALTLDGVQHSCTVQKRQEYKLRAQFEEEPLFSDCAIGGTLRYTQSTWTFIVPGTPKHVRLLVTRDGTSLCDVTLSPQYVRGDSCRYANVELGTCAGEGAALRISCARTGRQA
jgi:hypothetical protein